MVQLTLPRAATTPPDLVLTKIAVLGSLVAFNIGAFIGLLTKSFGTYVFNDWNFVAFLGVLVCIDQATGMWASFIQRDHNSKALGQLFGKLIYIGAALAVSHVMTKYTVGGESTPLFQTLAPAFKGGIYLTLLWREVISIEENLNKFGFGFLPKFIRKRMSNWLEDGETDKGAKTPEAPKETPKPE